MASEEIQARISTLRREAEAYTRHAARNAKAGKTEAVALWEIALAEASSLIAELERMASEG